MANLHDIADAGLCESCWSPRSGSHNLYCAECMKEFNRVECFQCHKIHQRRPKFNWSNQVYCSHKCWQVSTLQDGKQMKFQCYNCYKRSSKPMIREFCSKICEHCCRGEQVLDLYDESLLPLLDRFSILSSIAQSNGCGLKHDKLERVLQQIIRTSEDETIVTAASRELLLLVMRHHS
jgi:hypothetical protein